jgi:protein gp37
MSDNTEISWTDATWNPIRARLRDHERLTQLGGTAIVSAGTWGYHCERISPGCQHCYAERMNGRMLPSWGTGLDYTRPNRDKVEVYLDETELVRPLRWKKPRMIFPCSMTDLFGEWVPDEMIDRVFAVMALASHHVFQVLTKRAERLHSWAIGWGLQGRQSGVLESIRAKTFGIGHPSDVTYPLPNVWLGVSVEDRQRKDRIDHLRRTPAAVRWLSLEPLIEGLGTIDFTGISWCVIGGESGPGARPCDLAWIRSLIAQCRAAGVAPYCKQWGSHAVYVDPHDDIRGPVVKRVLLVDRKGANPEEWPRDIRCREYPEVQR